jgi:chromosome segregation ATPase
VGKLADPSVSSDPAKLESGALARLRGERDLLLSQNTQLAEQVQSLSSQNRGFSSQKKALNTKNKGLINQTKELTLTNDDLKRQVDLLKEKPSEKVGGRQEVEAARTETKRWKERNDEVVASLERVETQYAMMGQKLGEAVEAMSMMQDRVEQAKKQLHENNQQKLRLESTKAEVESELQVR